jgi:CheY-like chemotaxis protein
VQVVAVGAWPDPHLEEQFMSTTFSASFPASPVSPIAGARVPPPRVVIADGDGRSRRRMRAVLAYAGYVVEECGDGAALLDVIADIARRRAAGAFERLDLVFCALDVSKFGGLCVLESLTLAGWDVPFVLMSDDADRGASRRASVLRASGVLRKPFSAASLLAVVEALAPVSTDDGD